MALSEETPLDRVLAFVDYATQFAGGISLGDRPEQNVTYADLRALLDAARAEQKEDAEPVAVLDGKGWVYFGPDVGIEYAPEHPVDSGETPDATDVRRSTYFEDWLVGENQKLDGKVRELAVAHPPRAEQPVMSREAVARVVDPDVWKQVDGGEVSASALDVQLSLQKADAILALASPGGEQEAVRGVDLDAIYGAAMGVLRDIANDMPGVRAVHKRTVMRERARQVLKGYASPVRGAGEEAQ